METLNLNPDAAVALIAARTKAAVARATRRIAVGLAGGPGVGKSTIAAEVVRVLNLEVPNFAALVPMDGFHMRHRKLEEIGLVERKGAPETFEGATFAAFLMRIKGARRAVNGPGYSRQIEDVVDDAFTIPAEVKVLIVEGNYLLLPTPPWDLVKPLLDLSIFLHVPREKVMWRLMKRHAEAGLFTEKRNRAHVSRNRADLALELETQA
jgi:pantothenate kinase